MDQLLNAGKRYQALSHNPAHQISVLPDGSASCMLRSTGSEASNPDLRPIPPDLRPPISDLLPNPQIYAGSDNISSDLQPLRLDLMLSLQIWTRSANISSDLQSPKLDLMLYLQICTLQN